MASKNIVAKGTTYNGVESVTFPVSGGGDATFYEISDTTASASDVLNSKHFYTALGVLTQGTASGGSGGLVYETGTWTTEGTAKRPTISFANAHTTPPVFVMFVDATGTYSSTSNTNYVFVYADWYRLTGRGFYPSSVSQLFGAVLYMYRGTNAGSMSTGYKTLSVDSDSSDDSTNDCSKYWVDNTSFRPYSNSNDRSWRFDHIYKWIAVWAPTT